MAKNASGFKLIFDFEQRYGHGPQIRRHTLEIAHDGRAAYAQLHNEEWDRTARVWLFNHGPAPAQTGPGERPPLGRADALDFDGPPPQPHEFEAFQRSFYDWDFHISVRGEFLALLSNMTPLGWARLARQNTAYALKPPRRGDIWRQLIEAPRDEIWDALCDGPDDFQRAFAKLSEPLQHLVAVDRMYEQTCNGSLSQFFGNMGGGLAPEAVRGFRAMGLDGHAAILERAMALFGARFPRDEDLRIAVLEVFFAQAKAGGNNPLHALTTAFYDADAGGARDVVDAAEAFALRAIPGCGVIDYAAIPREPGVLRR